MQADMIALYAVLLAVQAVLIVSCRSRQRGKWMWLAITPMLPAGAILYVAGLADAQRGTAYVYLHTPLTILLCLGWMIGMVPIGLVPESRATAILLTVINLIVGSFVWITGSMSITKTAL